MPQLTTPFQFDTTISGYFLIALFSPENQAKIHQLQDELSRQFPGLLWLPRNEQLHITVLHLISPDREYDTNGDELYETTKDKALQALTGVIPASLKITVQFDTIQAFPAAIILNGSDNGALNELRSRFMSTFELPAQTRRPPEIIHSTIARYHQEYDFDKVNRAVSAMSLSFTQTIEQLHLVHETKVFAQEYDILHTFPT